jgi:hypothetical protein
VVAFSYLAIVLTLWFPFSPRSGLPYETGYVYTSEISTWWNGFVNGADHLRIYTTLFYQVAYLMGELSGLAGSFVPYQIVYAALWWARGFLVFLIGRRLAPGYDLFWYLTGALVLVHSSDYAAGWAGAGLSNHSGYTLWMPLAFYMLVLAFQQTERLPVRACLLLGVFFEHLSLWSYESQIVIILIAPLLLAGLYGKPWRRWLAMAAIWYVLPVIYIVATIGKYTHSSGHSYQQSVLRQSWPVGPILSDWLFNISASLKFWGWAGAQPAQATTSQLIRPAVLAVVLFLGGVALLVWLCGARRDKDHGWIPNRRTLWTAMLVGLLLLALSFPAYLILDSARSLWRTQILSGFGAALVVSSAIGLCASYVPRNWLRLGALAVLGSVVIAYGSFSVVKKTAFHRWVWDRHRHAMAQLLHTAPRLKPGTMVILINVPKEYSSDPFLGNNMLFDMAAWLAYPGAPVSGVYFYEDGTPANGYNLKITPEGVGAILALKYDQRSPPSIVRDLPKFLGVDENAARLYNPVARIESRSPTPRAVRRYGPLDLN